MKFFLACLGILLLSVTNESLAQNGNDMRSYREKADAEMAKRNYAEASLYYERWLEAMPRDADAALALARCKIMLQESESALYAFEKAARIGYAKPELIAADTMFRRFIGHKRFDKARLLIEKNKSDMEIFPFRYVPQTRMGRYRIAYPPAYSPNKRYNLIVMLHGNGNDPTLMLRLAQQMSIEDAIVISPEAAYLKFRESASSFNEKYSAAGEDRNFPDSLKDEIIDLSAQWYNSIIADAQSFLPLKTALPLIVGFSQGGFYASVIATRYPHRYAGVVTICASMYAEGKVIDNLKNLRKYGIPALVMHSTDDPVVPFQTGELLAGAMQNEKIDVEFYSYQGGHWINNEAMENLKRWLKEHLAK